MSSKRAIRRRACTGKQRFACWEEAFVAMKALLRNKGTDGCRPMNAYRCRFCGGWHYGHAPGTFRNGSER